MPAAGARVACTSRAVAAVGTSVVQDARSAADRPTARTRSGRMAMDAVPRDGSSVKSSGRRYLRSVPDPSPCRPPRDLMIDLRLLGAIEARSGGVDGSRAGLTQPKRL